MNKKYIPYILTGVSVLGVSATSVLTAKATLKAKEAVDEAEKERKAELEPKEVVRRTWKFYIPALLTGLATDACIVTSHVLNQKQQASLISACSFVDTAFNEYKAKTKEIYGEEAHQNIVNAIVAEKADKDVTVWTQNFFTTADLDFGVDSENHIFYLPCADIFFETTIPKVLEAEYHLNRNFAFCGDIPLNMFLKFLGLETRPEFNELRWYMDDDYYWIDFDHYQAQELDIPEWISSDRKILVIEPIYTPRVYDEV